MQDLKTHIFSFLSAVGPQNVKSMKVFIGLDAKQFQKVLSAVTPSLLSSFKNLDTLKLAVYIYLMKLRTNYTHTQIAALVNISHFTVSSWIRNVRKAVHESVVRLYLYN